MAGFPTLSATNDAAVLGYQEIFFRNVFTCTAALQPTSGWTTSTGLTVGGAVGAFGTLDGAPVLRNSASVGAMPVAAPGTGQSLWLSEIEATVTSGSLGCLYLFDKICDVLLTVATTALPGGILDATGTLASGEGGLLVAEVVTSMSAALGCVFPTYTNQSNVSHSLDITALAQNFNINNTIVQGAPLVLQYDASSGAIAVAGGPWYPWLAAGDTGVRTMTNLTASGTVAGTVNWSICRLVAHIELETLNEPVGRDLRFLHPILRPLRASPCLFWVYLPATASNATIQGKIKILSG